MKQNREYLTNARKLDPELDVPPGGSFELGLNAYIQDRRATSASAYHRATEYLRQWHIKVFAVVCANRSVFKELQLEELK